MTEGKRGEGGWSGAEDGEWAWSWCSALFSGVLRDDAGRILFLYLLARSMSVLLHGKHEDPSIIPECAVFQVSRDDISTVFWVYLLH